MQQNSIGPMQCRIVEGGMLIIDNIGTGIGIVLYHASTKLAAAMHVLRATPPPGLEANSHCYVTTAIPYAIEELQKRGARPPFSVAIAGGSSMIRSSGEHIGDKLAKIARKTLADLGITPKFDKTGGMQIRSIILNLDAGKIKVSAKDLQSPPEGTTKVVVCDGCRKSYTVQVSSSAVRAFTCPSCNARLHTAPVGGRFDRSIRQRLQDTDAEKDLPTGKQLKAEILASLGDLPLMSQVARKARELTLDEHATFRDLADVIETDQAIAVRVLKLANSSFYGRSGQVASLHQAAIVLGMKMLNEILTLACTGTMLGRELRGYMQDAGDLWLHSLATAYCARMVADDVNVALADDAFAAGLIHDCGKIVLDAYIHQRRNLFESFMSDGQHPFLVAEKELLGFDHGQIAAEVCKKWQIPKRLVRAVCFHHSPERSGKDELAYIVHAADAIALMSGLGSGIDGMMYEVSDIVMKSLRLDENAIRHYMEQAVGVVEDIRNAFSI